MALGAAVYQANFGTLANVSVKAVDDKKVDAFRNNDPAGTPENYKSALVRGGTGNGRKEYVGDETRSRLVHPDATPTSSGRGASPAPCSWTPAWTPTPSMRFAPTTRGTAGSWST